MAPDSDSTEEAATAAPADPAGAYGFGAVAKGGGGGKELIVTSLDDDPKSPQPGTLRWAVEQGGPRNRNEFDSTPSHAVESSTRAAGRTLQKGAMIFRGSGFA